MLNYTFSGNANDGTSNENNGTVIGAALTTDRFGEANSAYYFDGDQDYIHVPLSSSLKVDGDVTMSMWMYHEDGDRYTSRIITTPGYVYGIWTDDRDNGTRHYLVANGSGWGDGIGNGNWDNGEWKMVTVVASSETSTSNDSTTTTSRKYEMYIDGELITTSSPNDYNYKFSNNSDQRLFIGSEVGGENNFFKGKLDDIRIYNKALSAQDISKLYANSSVQNVNATISIPKGSTSGTVEIKGTDDLTDENNETIISKIISTTGASETGDQKATIVILDDDSTSVSLSATSTTINEGKDDYSTVKVTLNKVSELPITVKFKFSGVDSTDFLMKQEATLVTGENVTWLPSSWGQGEPNDSGVEDYAHLTGGGYNDHQATEQRQHIMELPFPYEKDYSGYNYLADYDGHAYYRSNDNSTWEEARASTEAIDGGYLMVISTEDEYNFISNYASSEWIGFYQDRTRDDYSEPLGGWTWVNSNYNPEVGEVTIPAGSTEASVYVFAKDDAVMGEADETMKLEFSEIVNGVSSDDKSVDITIKDNDILPNVTLSVDGTELTEGVAGFSTVTATLSVATTQAVSVKLSTSGDDITSEDYRFSDDTLSIASGGLAAHYTFDGDATDQSGNSNDGTVDGAVLTTDRFGKSNSAYYFDGENDKIKVPFTESLKIEDDITLNLWVNNEETGYETDFLLRSPNGYYHVEIHERDNDNSFQFYARGGGSWNSIHPHKTIKITHGIWLLSRVKQSMMRMGRSLEIRNIAYTWMESLGDLSTRLSGDKVWQRVVT